MASIRIGGDPESYMEAPVLSGGGEKGGASIIATVLDLLGVGKQVGKIDKADANPAASPSTTQSVPPAPGSLPVLNEAESAFQPSTPMPMDWGKRYLESIKPLKMIDPNTAL